MSLAHLTPVQHMPNACRPHARGGIVRINSKVTSNVTVAAGFLPENNTKELPSECFTPGLRLHGADGADFSATVYHISLHVHV